jgi:hypothetical protein
MASNKRKKNKNFIVTGNETLTATKAAQRQTMIDQGAQALRSSQVHSTPKDYRRNPKHRNLAMEF